MLNRFHGENARPGGGLGQVTGRPLVTGSGARPAFAPASDDADRFRFLAITPFQLPDLPLLRLLWRQDIATALDIGCDPTQWPALIESLKSEKSPGVGLCIPALPVIAKTLAALQLPAAVRFLIVDGDISLLPSAWRGLPVLVQVATVAEAERALAAGASGLIARGQESGGRGGDESSFILLQRVVALAQRWSAKAGSPVPVWCQGGIGLHTAAGAIAGGAAGVVLDSILALYPECALPVAIKSQIQSLDVGGKASVGGQDCALSRLALAECPNLESLISSLRMRVAGQLRQAQTLRVMDEGNPWAQSHGVRYPVAQGPMTRVSDTAAFASAVADAGGLPFLALSVMQETAARALLEDSRRQVGEKPWGVGVLGFAPPEILEPQLRLVKEFRPSALLLAGGRPSQAREFIAMGIPTYLHVPSPGLLEDFLKDGITHFVFEGRECGGHVGPRYSFVLWELALAQLAKFEEPEKLHILFAGGIHDERSAAMVAAIAAPLAARGAKIGVLMGTAYIATEEAVSCGSILQDFQDQALAGEQTVLVETAPGHAIRCLPSGFVDLFEREKERLGHEGVAQQEAWKALEALTVGRLRIATKGVDYLEGALAPVSLEQQRAEGMYMIGQAIALRHSVTTVAQLHAQVSSGATRHLAGIVVPKLARARNAEPVAVVGMACIYPGSPDLEAYWANILEGRDLVREVPAERWNAGLYYREGGPQPDRSVSKWGGFIDDTPFDPLQYGIPPQSLAAIEPVQLLSLQVASRALGDAGYQDKSGRWFDRQKTAVIFGAESGMDLANQYNFRNLYPQYCGELPEALARALPSMTEDSFPGVLVNVISGRIANRLGLGGTNYSVDAACASSLTAIELAVKELRFGSSDMVLAGGADFHNGIADFLMFSAVGALSPTGRCRAFDDQADGICLGEGVGIVVLKRLADAERDGDRIYAVIDGVAGTSDGRALGLTAPNKEGQKRALERAYAQAGALPAEIGLVEAHGTGTVVGDRTELRTLSEVFNAGGAIAGQAGLGSVKSQIGHTKCAAGIAGLIKVAKALHHRVLPPTQQIRTPNAAYRGNRSPFQLNRTPTPWLPAGGMRRGAVSAFGFGGTNFHALLSAYPAHQPCVGALQFPAELIAVRGETRAQAQAVLQRIGAYVDASDAPLQLRDLACTAWAAGEGPVQLAFAVTDVESLKRRIVQALAGEARPGLHYRDDSVAAGKLAFLFSGQGSQYPGMLRELFVYFPHLLDASLPGRDYLPLMFPETAYDEQAGKIQRQRLTDTRNAQPALGVVELAAFDWLRALGLQPDMAGGHSYGELAALATAGAFDAATLTELSRARADAVIDSIGSDPGAMLAVQASPETLRPLLAERPGVAIANHNSLTQTVVSGATADVRALGSELERRGIRSRTLDTQCAFHSPVVAGAGARFSLALERKAIGALQWPVYSNVSAAPHASRATEIRKSLAEHVVSPVRFVEQIERMHADGARVFVEIGPRRVLTGLVGSILADKPHRAIAIDGEERGLAGTFDALAQMAVLLSAFDASVLFARRAERLDLDVPRRLAPTTWMVNGGRAWPRVGEAPAHATSVVTAPVVNTTIPISGAPAAILSASSADAADRAVLEYLGNLREMVRAQRDVLVQYLGADGKRDSRTIVMDAAPVAVRHEATIVEVKVPERPADPQEALLAVVSQCTGYPTEHLDPDLDLEADLSIDSIKRLEVIGKLASRLGVADGSREKDEMVERLSPRKTLRSMIDWLRGQAFAPQSQDAAGTVLVDAATPASAEPALGRYVLRSRDVPMPASGSVSIAGKVFLITDDGLGIASRVATLLEAGGAKAAILDFHSSQAYPEQLPPIDGLVHLWSLNPASQAADIKRFFSVVRKTLQHDLRHLLVASGLGGDFGAAGVESDPGRGGGLAGLVKTVAKEFPGLRAHWVDLDPAELPEALAESICHELLADDPLPEVAWRGGRRFAREAVPLELTEGSLDGLPLTSDSVVLLTGGARGITSLIAVALAHHYRCQIEIVGRSPVPPETESPQTIGVDDPRELRRVLLAAEPSRRPAEVEQLVRRTLADREFRRTLAEIRAAGARANYTSVDVCDTEAFSGFIAGLYTKHARIDGVIHGAGVVEDKLVRDKSDDSFARVFDTKVSSALVLNRLMRNDVKFVVFFSSVASAFGNRGQVDYAAANDVLDKLAHSWQARIPGRVLSVNWGPWADTGMVSDALRQEYHRRGIGLIPREQGVNALLRELSVGRGDAQVVLMCARPESFGVAQ